ncbi:hypothetical protein HRbin26_01197 [bacterium HR26]|nr:hypothetical protein HRbin26_01197 [bacterium HR26]
MRRMLILFLLALNLLPWPVAAAETGTISGVVRNGTAGGGSVEGLTVTLRRFRGMELAQEYTVTVGADGRFTFADLPIADGEAYLAFVTYQGVEYSSSMIQLTQNPSVETEVAVYETTTDPSVVSIGSRSLVVAGAAPELKTIDIMDIVIVNNQSDRTYLGGPDGAVLRLPLPEGALEISPQPGFDYGQPRLEADGTLVTTGPLPPGTHNVVLSYSVPYSGTRATLTVGTAMPTGTLRVLVREGTYELSSRSLLDSGTVEVSGVLYRVFSIDGPVVGDRMTVQVSKLPRAGGGLLDLPLGPLIAAVVAGIGLIIASVLTYQIVKQRRASTEPVPGEAGVEPEEGSPAGEPVPGDERLELAAALNRLDEQRAAGEIDEESYQAQREEILGRLRALVLRQRGLDEAVH